MQDKVKASDLFIELMLASQVAMASEDNNIINRISENHPELSHSNELFIKDLAMNNEYIRISTIKTIILILIKHNIVEEDIDILNSTNSNNLISKAMDIFEKTKQEKNNT